MPIERYTVAQAAELLDCEPETVAEGLKKGTLPGVKIGRSWIIPAAALDRRLNELALEEAEARRAARQQMPASAESLKAARPASTSGSMPNRKRTGRTPPALPALA